MEEADYGIWFPSEGGYRKKCITCGGLFVGRKNKIHCCDKCKSMKNNEVARIRRDNIKSHVGPYLMNMKILEDEFNKGDGDVVKVTMEKIKVLGFDDGAPCKEFVYGHEKWFLIGKYAYRPNEGEGTLQIQKLG